MIGIVVGREDRPWEGLARGDPCLLCHWRLTDLSDLDGLLFDADAEARVVEAPAEELGQFGRQPQIEGASLMTRPGERQRR